MTNRHDRAEAQDPETPPEVLMQIARDCPELRDDVAANPSCYPELREWLAGIASPGAPQPPVVTSDQPPVGSVSTAKSVGPLPAAKRSRWPIALGSCGVVIVGLVVALVVALNAGDTRERPSALGTENQPDSAQSPPEPTPTPTDTNQQVTGITACDMLLGDGDFEGSALLDRSRALVDQARIGPVSGEMVASARRLVADFDEMERLLDPRLDLSRELATIRDPIDAIAAAHDGGSVEASDPLDEAWTTGRLWRVCREYRANPNADDPSVWKP